MEKLRMMLDASRVKKGAQYNLVSMKCGTFYVPVHLFKKFLKYYGKALQEMTSSTSESLVWSVRGKKFKPMTIDIDIIREGDTEFTDSELIELAEQLTSVIVKKADMDEVGVFLTRKKIQPKVYQNHELFKTGMHIYIIGMEVTKAWAMQIRPSLLEIITVFCKAHKIINTPDEVMDDKVTPFGENGILFNCEFKPNCEDRYYIFYRALFDQSFTNALYYKPEQWLQSFTDNYDQLYSFLTDYLGFADEVIKKIDVASPIETTVAIPTQTRTDYNSMTTNLNFDLAKFLEDTRTRTPDHQEYCTIIYFLAHIKFPVDVASTLTNQYWNADGKWDTDETARIMNTYENADRYFDKESVIKYYMRYSADKWVEDIASLFSTRSTVYYNDCKRFMSGTYDLDEVIAFITGFCDYVIEHKVFVYLAYTNEVYKGKKIKNIRRVLSQHPPFKGTDDFEVSIRPSYEDVIKVVHKMIKGLKPKKDKKRIEQLEQLLTLEENFMETAQSTLKAAFPPPNRMDMSFILLRAQKQCKIKRYDSLTFYPYTLTPPDLDSNVLNTFCGFPMMHYTPSRTVDPNKTMIMQFLYEVYNHGNEDMKQLNFILDLMSWKLKYPHLRSEKIWCVISSKQGTGKSTIFYLWEFLVGKKLCLFHCTLESLCCRFNIENSSKLIHHIDDLQASGPKETRKLFPIATARKLIYEGKGEKRIQMDEMAMLWVTSNFKSPLFTGAHDRRQVILPISPCWKGQKGKFDKLYDEMDDLDIAYAWFHFLLDREIGKFSPSDPPPIDGTPEAKLKCMSTSHRFIKDFFAQEDFPELLYDPRSNISLCALSNETELLVITCGKKTLYNAYKKFCQEFYSGSSVRLNTFTDQILEVGVRLRGRTRYREYSTQVLSITLDYPSVAMKYDELYEIELERWYCETNKTSFLRKYSTTVS
jgi:hypothetical protein